MSRSRRQGLLPLLWRQFGSERGASIAITGVVLVVAFLSAAAPRALEVMTSAELAGTVSSIPPTTRDLRSSLFDAPPLGPSATGDAFEADLDPIWGALDDGLRAVRADVPEPARDLLGDPRFAVNTTALLAEGYELGDDPFNRLLLLADPLMAEQIRMVEGELPAVPDRALADFDALENLVDTEPRTGAPLEFILSVSSAETMNWPVGAVRYLNIGPVGTQAVKLSGTFEAVDAASDYWQLTPTTLDAEYVDDGNRRPTATGGAFVNPLGWDTVSAIAASTNGVIVQTRMWFPLDGADIEGASAERVLAQLRQVTSKAVGITPDAATAPRVTFSTGVVDALGTIIARSTATTSVLLMATAGPLGVAIAVLALAARLVADRRRPTLALIAARGGSNAQLRSVLALEGLVLGLPAAIAGIVGAVLLIPARTTPGSFLLPILVGLAPAALFALAAAPGSLRQVRSDLGQGGNARRRVIVELVAIVLAVASVTFLLLRGLQVSDTAGVDPLLVATPLLLSLAACVVVLRLFPLPLAAIERRLRARKGVVGFVGAARALRDPVAGLAPVLAMVVAVSVAVFSGAMFATLTVGVDSAAESSVGGDLRARGPIFFDEQVTAANGVAGVRDAVALQDAGTSSLTVGRQSHPVSVLLADTAALAALQSGLADAAPALPALAQRDGDAVPIVMSKDLAAELGAELDEGLTMNGQKLSIVATADRIAGSGVPEQWIYVDREFTDTVVTGGFVPRILVVALDAGADETTVAEALEQATASTFSVSTRTQAAADIRSSAFVTGLQQALAIVLVLVALLTAVAIVLVSTINNRSRSRLLAVLRTLGLSRRQSTALIAWELSPIAVTAFVGGAALGIALPLIVLAGIDLRPFTGGAAQPALVIDPWLTAAVLGGFALIVVAASLAAAIGSRITNLAAVLKTGEE